ncbi:MAG: polyketide synthase dehydratase domain-containing protein [Desulfopila sp.]
MTEVVTVQVALPIPTWYRDHRLDGRTVLPAVEAMALLVGSAREKRLTVGVNQIQQAEFTRFVHLADAVTQLEATLEFSPTRDNRLRARLLTRKRFKSICRMVYHCELLLWRDAHPPTPSLQPAAAPPLDALVLEAEQIYRELVPFGPAYRTLCGQVYLTGRTALATVRGPDLPVTEPALGSPFCLDGAMHAACVHGQRLVDFVPFPVAFTSRSIFQPTRPAEGYRVEVQLQRAEARELLYDLSLWDATGRLSEKVDGLRMRDVSSGRIRPPDWIRNSGP